jgi:hypothetical protein
MYCSNNSDIVGSLEALPLVLKWDWVEFSSATLESSTVGGGGCLGFKPDLLLTLSSAFSVSSVDGG